MEDCIKRIEEADLPSVEAQHGERMIVLKVRFFTDGLAEEDGKIKPRHAWAQGMIDIERNGSHDIRPKAPKASNSLFELMKVIEGVLREHGVKLHFNRTCGKVFAKSWSQ